MNQEVCKKWVNAMRHGNYRQGWGALKQENDDGFCYCPLGVLCDIAEQDRVVRSSPWIDATWQYHSLGSPVTDTGFLPAVVQEWADLSTSSPMLEHNGKLHRITSLNDNPDLSLDFQDFADMVEKAYAPCPDPDDGPAVNG